MKIPKSAGLWEVDVAWDDDATDLRRVDVYAAREWHFERLKEAEEEAEACGRDRPSAVSLWPRLAAEFLALPADQWPPHRAAFFWNAVFDRLDALKKAAAG